MVPPQQSPIQKPILPPSVPPVVEPPATLPAAPEGGSQQRVSPAAPAGRAVDLDLLAEAVAERIARRKGFAKQVANEIDLATEYDIVCREEMIGGEKRYVWELVKTASSGVAGSQN